jgi:hypothetical protein
MRITKTHKFFAFALILLFSTISFGKSEVSKEEYEIYSAAISGVYAVRPINISLLIKNYTVNDIEELKVKGRFWNQLSILLRPLSPETIDSYLKENQKESVLDNEFDLKMAYTLIKRSEIEPLFKRGVGSGEIEEWDNFRKKFPDVKNVIGFSRIGYNTEKSQALVYMEEWCGFLCGMGYCILLEKEDGKWKLISQFSPWAS